VTIFNEYAARFAKSLQDPASPRAVRLGKTLAKIGLVVDGGAIVISNQARWPSISMMGRVQFRLSSTINVLESFHGHGNEETPRRNDFIPSMARINGRLSDRPSRTTLLLFGPGAFAFSMNTGLSVSRSTGLCFSFIFPPIYHSTFAADFSFGA
jgi:hypothetical protein